MISGTRRQPPPPFWAKADEARSGPQTPPAPGAAQNGAPAGLMAYAERVAL